MPQLQLSQAGRLILAVIMTFAPLLAPLVVRSYGLSNADLSALPFVGGLVLLSLVVVLAALLVSPPPTNATVFTTLERFGKVAYGNAAFVVLDLGIFALLVYGRHYAPHGCTSGPNCDLYPMGWLALAGSHFCWLVMAVWFKVKCELRLRHAHG